MAHTGPQGQALPNAHDGPNRRRRLPFYQRTIHTGVAGEPTCAGGGPGGGAQPACCTWGPGAAQDEDQQKPDLRIEVWAAGGWDQARCNVETTAW